MPLQLNDDAERRKFSETFIAFWNERGCAVKYPTLGHKELDLYRLYQEVTKRGGIEEVTNEKRWKEITRALHVPSSCTNAGYTLKTHYLKFLYTYERKFFFGLDENTPFAGSDSPSTNLVKTSASNSKLSNIRDREGTIRVGARNGDVAGYRPERIRRDSEGGRPSRDRRVELAEKNISPHANGHGNGNGLSIRRTDVVRNGHKRKHPVDEDTAFHPSTTVDFSKLDLVTLKRYCKHYKLHLAPDSPKTALVKAVTRHFAADAVEENEVLRHFLGVSKRHAALV